MAMAIQTNTSQLKAKLGQFMRAVRAGKTVVITDRDTPVARLVPYKDEDDAREERLVAKPRDPASPPLGKIEVKAIRYDGPSSTELLREDRNRR